MDDMIVVGGGTAGMTAALYGVRAGMKVKVFDKAGYGGQIISTQHLENFPSVASTSGMAYATDLYNQITALGVEFIFDEIISLQLDGESKKVIAGSGEHFAKTVVLALGSLPREIEAKNAFKFKGRGISYCVSCDGAFYKGKKVAVVGGGNSATSHALELASMVEKVYVIHRRDEFRADSVEVEKMRKADNIELVTPCVITSVNGKASVDSITVENVEDKTVTDIALDGIFVSIGWMPQSGLVKDLLPLDDAGYIIAGEDCTTKIDGVFVAGDCRTKELRQLVTAASDGAMAAVKAKQYIVKTSL